MKNTLLALTFSLCAWIGHVSCSQRPTKLQVRKNEIINGTPHCFQATVHFFPETSIAAIKKAIYSGNRIPVLTIPASEPGEVATRLENGKTCAYYGIDYVDLTLKTQAQIAAEFQAVTPLKLDVIGVVLSYDPDFYQADQKS